MLQSLLGGNTPIDDPESEKNSSESDVKKPLKAKENYTISRLASALQGACCRAGRSVAIRTRSASIQALIKFLWIIIGVLTSNTRTLLVRVIIVLRTACGEDC